MATVILHGDLRQFGERFTLDVASPSEAVRALCGQIRGFRKRLSDGAFRIIRRVAAAESDIDLNMMGMKLDAPHELHVVPVVAGSKGGGGSKAMIGIAIIAAAFTMGAGAFIAAGDMALAGTAMSASAFSIAGIGVSFAQIAGIGAMMVLGGVTQMLSPAPKGSTNSGAATNASFTFSGPVNSSEQGNAVPLVYGRFTAGSVVMSSDMAAEKLQGNVDVEQGGAGVGAQIAISSVSEKSRFAYYLDIDAGGRILGLTIRAGGNYYINPFATVKSNTGSGAQIALTASSGVITGATIVNPGVGYDLTDTVVIGDSF